MMAERTRTVEPLKITDPILDINGLYLYYGNKEALCNISLAIPRKRVTAFIGPSGCGKSTLLRCFNRMNDLIEGIRVVGTIKLDGEDINAPDVDVIQLRAVWAWYFKNTIHFPNPSTKTWSTAYVLLGSKPTILNETVEKSLRAAALWDEVKDRLRESALRLSGGQMQRLCIARAIAVQPDIILMDEPCSALDPIATSYIEDLIDELKQEYTVIIVTHNMQQAARVSDYTAFCTSVSSLSLMRPIKCLPRP